MKILYFGTVCHIDHYEKLIKNCKKKPTVATVVFESALLEGFQKNGAEVEIHSFPMVPTFPNSRLLHFGGTEELLKCGYPCRWLNTVNIPFLKQWSRRADARRILKRWARENAGDGVILTYSIPPFLAKDIVEFGRKYRVKTAAIVPDLPANMYLNHKGNPLVDAVKNRYLNRSLQYQAAFDGYIYLAEAMRDAIAPGKPYMVMEGILNAGSVPDCPKASPRAVMYAGRLHEKYGVMNLVDAFDRLHMPDTELWLFGEGTAVADIQERAKQNPQIRYFGRVSREEILRREAEATLLVNPRSVKDAFTRYSFPSKTIEYMYSGTPLLTTKLEGIPEEYFDYVFSAEDNDPALLADALRDALSLPEDALREMGAKARRFICERKNAAAQSKRILHFLWELLGETYEEGQKNKL